MLLTWTTLMTGRHHLHSLHSHHHIDTTCSPLHFHHHHHINVSTTTTTTTPHRHATNESQWLIGRFSTHHCCQRVFMTRWWAFLASPPTTSPTTTTNESSGLVGGFIWSLHPRQPTTAFSVDHNTHHGHHRVVETQWVFLVSPSTTPPTTATNESLWLVGRLFWPLHPHHPPPPPPMSPDDSLVVFLGLSTPMQPTIATNVSLWLLGGFLPFSLDRDTHYGHQQVLTTRWWFFLVSPPSTLPTTATNEFWRHVGG